MDFAGVDRSRVSLRQQAVTKLGLLDAESSAGYIEELVDALKDSGIGGQPLYPREFEVLTALASAAQHLRPGDMRRKSVYELLTRFFSVAHNQDIVSSTTLRNAAPAPWHQLTTQLTRALLALDAPTSLFIDYIERAAWLWNESLSDDDLIKYVFSLHGLLDGLAQSPYLSIEVSEIVFEWVETFWKENFFSMLYSRLTEVEQNLAGAQELSLPKHALLTSLTDTMIYPGATQFALTVANFIRNILRILVLKGTNVPHQNQNQSVIGLVLDKSVEINRQEILNKQHASYLEKLAHFATVQLENLDNNHFFRSSVTPHLVPISSRTLWVLLEPIALALYFNLQDPEAALSIFKQAAESDQLDQKDDDARFNIIRLACVCCNNDPETIQFIARCLPSYFGAVGPETATQAATILVRGIPTIEETSLVSCIYTLMNTINLDESLLRKQQFQKSEGPPTLESEFEADAALQRFCTSILSAVASIVVSYDAVSIYGLAVTVFSQKYGSVSTAVDCALLDVYGAFAPLFPERDFEAILDQILRSSLDARQKNKQSVLEHIAKARTAIGKALTQASPLHHSYLDHILTLIVRKGDVHKEDQNSEQDLSIAAKEAMDLLEPLAALLPGISDTPLEISDWKLMAKFRDAWFNLAMLGFNKNSTFTRHQIRRLEIVAHSTPPLVSETSANQVESDLELNPVLRREYSTKYVGNQKKIISGIFGHKDIRPMPFLKIMFTSTTIFLEHFRARSGIISKIILYFGDPDFRSGTGFLEMNNIAMDCAREYVSYVASSLRQIACVGDGRFSLHNVAAQLKEVLMLCCHRIDAVRDVALSIADFIVSNVPSALCHKTSLFALLDLLTLIWQACVDSEEDMYQPRTTFSSEKSGVSIQINDSLSSRRTTLKKLLESARKWSGQILPTMNEEVKGILTLYLDDLDTYDDDTVDAFDYMALGRSFALELGGSVKEGLPSSISNHKGEVLANGASGFLIQYLSSSSYNSLSETKTSELNAVCDEFNRLCSHQDPKSGDLKAKDLRKLYLRAAPFIRHGAEYVRLNLAKQAVHLPFRFINSKNIKIGISFWLWVFNEVPWLRAPMIKELSIHWSRSIYRRVGLFSRKLDKKSPLHEKMEYAPSSKEVIDFESDQLTAEYAPHVQLIRFIRSSFHASVHIPGNALDLYGQMVRDGMYGLDNYASMHGLARGPRLELVDFAFEFLKLYSRHRPHLAKDLQRSTIHAALSWYRQPPSYPFGSNNITHRKESTLMENILAKLEYCDPSGDLELLKFFLYEDYTRCIVWQDPLGTRPKGLRKHVLTSDTVSNAWKVDPRLAVHLMSRHPSQGAITTLIDHVEHDPLRVVEVPEAVQYLLEKPKSPRRRYLLYWAQVSPIECINLFNPAFGGDSYLLQYAMRSLETHPIETCFFYVPQIVQSLRHDVRGYVEEYILAAAKFSQLFAHQIIWNIQANLYKDDDMTEPDSMKPQLDKVLVDMKAHFTPKERDFYDTEFNFFGEVTSISGKLKPFIKAPKAEKKAKIDEELAKIVVPENVYLPSNPDGVVIDLDRDSGKPLQSHAKAPFLARFKIRKDVKVIEDDQERTKKIDFWQGAIFKVGDDCRQDVLALQIISVFRNIFNGCGLDVFVLPYRVTATATGCGVIDVIPNSISRDMLGREAVNGLHEWFLSKHGSEDSIAYQRARENFVKSMAAYSVITYLIQFKDRHNGNIMYDDDGHVIHIDFGFCFEIVPGGVKFEAAPFKLTKEMVAVMGGSTRTQPYNWFEKLCVKAFLAARVYAEDIIRMVEPMLESGLPCFKNETVKKLRGRLVLNRTEREAADFMRSLINKSYQSTFTKGYDEFQRITNGIPY